MQLVEAPSARSTLLGRCGEERQDHLRNIIARTFRALDLFGFALADSHHSAELLFAFVADEIVGRHKYNMVFQLTLRELISFRASNQPLKAGPRTG
jgi:hypothetical protein